jgi:hypothetical protein
MVVPMMEGGGLAGSGVVSNTMASDGIRTKVRDVDGDGVADVRSTTGSTVVRLERVMRVLGTDRFALPLILTKSFSQHGRF